MISTEPLVRNQVNLVIITAAFVQNTINLVLSVVVQISPQTNKTLWDKPMKFRQPLP